jgi:hypothetical protein
MAQRFNRRHLQPAEFDEALSWSKRDINVAALKSLKFSNRILILGQVISLTVVTVVQITHSAKEDDLSDKPKSTILALLAWNFLPTRWAIKCGYDAFVYTLRMTPPGFLGLMYRYTIMCLGLSSIAAWTVMLFLLNLTAILAVLCVIFWGLFKICKRLTLLRALRMLSVLLLGGTTLYYVKFFDSSGTSKRAWSDVLG